MTGIADVQTIDYGAALTIAGSDPGGGAGIQADLKTFGAFGVFGTSVITAITVQNLSGFFGVAPVEPQWVRRQLLAVLEGFPINAIKTGMLYSAEIIEVIAGVLAAYREIPLIIDPVFSATSGGELFRTQGITSLQEKLFPMAALITPNIPEAETLMGLKPATAEEMVVAARQMADHYGVPVLLKGGHLAEGATDVLADGEGCLSFPGTFIPGVNTHGSGCTLASAIAASLVAGKTLRQAVAAAKEYMTAALRNPIRLSADTAIINHFPFLRVDE